MSARGACRMLGYVVLILPVLAMFGCKASSQGTTNSTIEPVTYREPPPPVTYQDEPADAQPADARQATKGAAKSIEVVEGKPAAPKSKKTKKVKKRRKKRDKSRE